MGELTGYELSSVEQLAELVTDLGDSPSPADVYEASLPYSERALGAVAATQGGGGAAVQTREQINGNNVTIANGATATLTWDANTGGNATLLDLTVPTLPTAIAAGVYAVSVQINSTTALTAGGLFIATLDLDAAGEDPEIQDRAPAIAGNVSELTFAMTYYIPAGGQLQVQATNQDGVASRAFNLFAVVQRLS